MVIQSLIYRRSKCKSLYVRKFISFILAPYFFFKNSYIGGSAIFTSVPCFPHDVSGIFISSGAKIGKNCVIFHQVTIGSNTLENSKNIGAPTIGDNVFIGAGAKIIGKVHIGNNVRIGAGAVVVCDVPDNSTVVSQPCKIIKRNEKRTNVFVGFDNSTY